MQTRLTISSSYLRATSANQMSPGNGISILIALRRIALRLRFSLRAISSSEVDAAAISRIIRSSRKLMRLGFRGFFGRGQAPGVDL